MIWLTNFAIGISLQRELTSTIFSVRADIQKCPPDNGTGKIVLSLGSKPTVPLSDKTTVRHSGIRAYAMVPRTRSAHVTRR